MINEIVKVAASHRNKMVINSRKKILAYFVMYFYFDINIWRIVLPEYLAEGMHVEVKRVRLCKMRITFILNETLCNLHRLSLRKLPSNARGIFT